MNEPGSKLFPIPLRMIRGARVIRRKYVVSETSLLVPEDLVSVTDEYAKRDEEIKIPGLGICFVDINFVLF